MCSKSRTVGLVCLSWCSETYVSIEEIYSGACPVMLLYTMRQVWYWTRFGNGSQFSSLKSYSEGVMKSAFKIILAARFWSFTSLVRLAFVYYPKLHIQNRTLGDHMSYNIVLKNFGCLQNYSLVDAQKLGHSLNPTLIIRGTGLEPFHTGEGLERPQKQV